MEIRQEKAGGKQPVLPSNPNFSFLALRAAVELDDILRDRPSSGGAVRELAEALKESTGPVGSAALTSLADPLSADLVGRALEQQSAKPIETVNALVEQANEVVLSLGTATQGSPKEKVRYLRDFCLALCQVAGSFHQEGREQARPRHSYRRD